MLARMLIFDGMFVLTRTLGLALRLSLLPKSRPDSEQLGLGFRLQLELPLGLCLTHSVTCPSPWPHCEAEEARVEAMEVKG